MPRLFRIIAAVVAGVIAAVGAPLMANAYWTASTEHVASVRAAPLSLQTGYTTQTIDRDIGVKYLTATFTNNGSAPIQSGLTISSTRVGTSPTGLALTLRFAAVATTVDCSTVSTWAAGTVTTAALGSGASIRYCIELAFSGGISSMNGSQARIDISASGATGNWTVSGAIEAAVPISGLVTMLSCTQGPDAHTVRLTPPPGITIEPGANSVDGVYYISSPVVDGVGIISTSQPAVPIVFGLADIKGRSVSVTFSSSSDTGVAYGWIVSSDGPNGLELHCGVRP